MGDPFDATRSFEIDDRTSGSAINGREEKDAEGDEGAKTSPVSKTQTKRPDPLFGRSLYGAQSLGTSNFGAIKPKGGISVAKQKSGAASSFKLKDSLLAWQQRPGTSKVSDAIQAEKEKQLSPEETKIKKFINENKMSVSDGLKQMVEKHKFTLVGEHHLPRLDPMRQEIGSSLASLKEKGLTHVGLEIRSTDQQRLDKLDYSKPIEELKKEIRHPEMAEVLIAAKRAGLKTVYLDKAKPEGISAKNYNKLSYSAPYQNSRDQHMFDQLTGAMGKKDKALIYIGSAHVHESSVSKTNNGKIHRLGALLNKEHGGDQVGSVRSVLPSSSFDGLIFSDNPSLDDVMPKHTGFMILPDDGPLMGDPRVTNSDYIITGR